MTPVELLDDHRRRPRNLGKLLNATVSGDVGSIVAGDALRFYLKLDGERIAEARFQVFNAADQVAATSALTEMLPGRTLAEALALRPADLCAHLGGLDPAELPPLLWGLHALGIAAGALRGELPEGDAELDPLLCRCHGIPEETVRQSIAVMALTEVQAVVDATGAGTACGSCRADIPRLLAAPPAEAAPAAPRRGGAQGRIPTMLRIQALVAAKVQAAVQADGGTIELWDFDGTTVQLSVRGLSDEARRRALAGVEAAIRSEIAPNLAVAERRS